MVPPHQWHLPLQSGRLVRALLHSCSLSGAVHLRTPARSHLKFVVGMDAQPANEQQPRFTFASSDELQVPDAGAASFDLLLQSAQHEQQATPGEQSGCCWWPTAACCTGVIRLSPVMLCSWLLACKVSARHTCLSM